MTGARRERSARTKFYAFAAAAALASLALFATVTVGLTRREADRRREPAKPQGVPPSRPTAGIVGGGNAPSTEFPWMVTLYDSAPQPTTRPPTQESSPTSRPTEPSATPDDPLGLPEESATAAPTAESDGALGRRLARAAAACALAALLL